MPVWWTTTARSTGKSVDYEAEGFLDEPLSALDKKLRETMGRTRNRNAPLVSLLFSLHMIKKKH